MPLEEDSMAYDLLIKNGMVVDGTGAPARQADVAITGGAIAEIGRVSGGAATVIDADGLVVAPGFIDPHTHYDAQICWDGAVTPSSWHGVTSVIMGNCGVGIAPCKPKAREIAMRDLVNVEAIPFDVLNMGITWDWETFPEFIEAAARRSPSLNLGFLAPLTPFRHYVMGEASMERAATPDETAKIKALLGEAIEAGAAHRARGAAADLAAAAHARHQYAQPVFLRGVPELESRVRRQVEAGPGGRLRRSCLPQPVP